MEHPTLKSANKSVKTELKGHGETEQPMSPEFHRRILNFINKATSPFDLMQVARPPMDMAEGFQMQADNMQTQMPVKLLDEKTAKALFGQREANFPLGFRNISEIEEFKKIKLGPILAWLSNSMIGSWQALPYTIPVTNGSSVRIIHAALLHTGKVLFIDDGSTPIWDPTDEVNPQFETPVANPTYSLTCCGHSFLSDGKLLALGGGGFGPIPGANKGFKFDPVTKAWSATAGSMNTVRWYPTAVTTGDKRVLVVGGWDQNAQLQSDIEVYDEASDSFSAITGATLGFPNLYPGLHLLPNNILFYSRTGWGHAGSAPPASSDSSSYFSFSGTNSGSWNPIAPSTINRCKGMSVMILKNTCPHTRILVVGGTTPTGAGIDSAEIIDVSILSPGSSWSGSGPLPDLSPRRQCNAVLLPDNTVFVAGGVDHPNSPCMLFDPVTNSWSVMADLPSVRMYHSVMILLPSGKLMMSGWANDSDSNTIELYSPPYLFKGARPSISAAPSTISRGMSFTVSTPDATTITKLTMVKPMAVTHQTESNQRVFEIPFLHDHTHLDNLIATAPTGGTANSNSPSGYYMLFAINNNGVPSIAKWIYLN